MPRVTALKITTLLLRTFFIPGEYYYICYIHNSMIGKLTVTER
jgi:plastocyanin